jgi:hypothetical protein
MVEPQEPTLKSIAEELKKMYTEQQIFNSEQKLFISEQKLFNSEVRLFIATQEKYNKMLNGKVSTMLQGMGKSLEKFSGVVVKLLHDNPSIKMDEIEVGKRFVDRSGYVNPHSKNFEVDIFCKNPLVVAEVTTFVKDSEISKIHRLTRVVKFLEKKHKMRPKAYLFTLGIDNDIRSEVTQVCHNAGVTIVCD